MWSLGLLIALPALLSLLPALQAFVADCTAHFHRMQKKQSWADTDYRNGAEAMAAILEVMRRHEVFARKHLIQQMFPSTVT